MAFCVMLCILSAMSNRLKVFLRIFQPLRCYPFKQFQVFHAHATTEINHYLCEGRG